MMGLPIRSGTEFEQSFWPDRSPVAAFEVGAAAVVLAIKTYGQAVKDSAGMPEAEGSDLQGWYDDPDDPFLELVPGAELL